MSGSILLILNHCLVVLTYDEVICLFHQIRDREDSVRPTATADLRNSPFGGRVSPIAAEIHASQLLWPQNINSRPAQPQSLKVGSMAPVESSSSYRFC